MTYTAVRAADGTYTVTADKIGATVYAVAQSGNNITNGLVEASIEIIKVEKGHKDNDHTLSGAKFQLTKVDENGNNVSGADAYQSEIVTVDPATGKTEFAGLRPGRYKLEEKESPEGYILAESPWYFTVDSSGTAELQAGYSYTLASPVGEGYPNEFWIENTPGAALPNTGGPGTNLIYLFGIMLTGLAGAGLVMKRRRRNSA